MTVPAAASDLIIAVSTESVRQIGPWLHTVLAGLPPEEASRLHSRLELAVHEVAMNILDHAGLATTATIRFSADIVEQSVSVTVTDAGTAFVPDGIQRPVSGVPQERGYGLLIVHKLVDDLDYRRVDDHNRWTLRVTRTRPAGRPHTGNEHQP
jgi:anti-sigma regulatory factor (Ser/Thr protein kinase)